MKRLGLKKITPMCLPLAREEFKRGVVLIISTIILLLVGVAMTGCATFTKLGTAAHGGDIREVEALLNKGVDVNERGLSGVTPLYEAVLYKCSLDIIRLLLDKGADPNLGMGLWKPIHLGVDNGNADVVKLLLDRGADTTVLNAHGKTPLKMAEEKGLTVIARMLREAEEKQYRKSYAKDEKPTPSVFEDKPVPKSDVDELPAIKARPNKNAYAIVIGIEQYRQKLPKADFATNDAKIISEYLTKTMGYPEENVITLINDRALKSDMEKYFDRWLINNVEENGRVFVYYSGHGAPNTKNGDAYLVPYDGDPTFIAETGYPIARLYESLGKLKAKEIIVVLDSCFSGGGGRSVLAKGAKPLVITMNVPNIQMNIAVMTASSGDQISSAYEEKGHGLFTYFLLKGIKNEDVVNPDGSIKMDDLFGYIKPQVERIARKQYNNEQTPQLIGAKKN